MNRYTNIYLLLLKEFIIIVEKEKSERENRTKYLMLWTCGAYNLLQMWNDQPLPFVVILLLISWMHAYKRKEIAIILFL